MREFLASLRPEPYRLLFPLGLAMAAVGMGLWIPAWLGPGAFPYPGQAHATLMIQGFLLCFVLGFLGTMLPKVLGVRPLGPAQFLVLPAGLVAFAAFAVADMPRAAQAMHLAVVLNFVLFVARRIRGRQAPPPPPFVFIGLAFLADIAGTCLRIHALPGFLGGQLGPGAHRAGLLLQYQAFPLLLILGVGSFLLPKFFAGAVVDPKTLREIPGVFPKGLFALGLLFLATYALEAWGPAVLGAGPALRLAYAGRAGVWAWFLYKRVGLHRIDRAQPAYLQGARLSLRATAAGLLLPVLGPGWILAWEHVVFIGGILWLTLSIAARVVAAHGGRLDLLGTLGRYRRRTLGYGALVVGAAMVRVATDLWISSRSLHLAFAAFLGLAVLLLWAWNHGSLLLRFPGRPGGRPA